MLTIVSQQLVVACSAATAEWKFGAGLFFQAGYVWSAPQHVDTGLWLGVSVAKYDWWVVALILNIDDALCDVSCKGQVCAAWHAPAQYSSTF